MEDKDGREVRRTVNLLLFVILVFNGSNEDIRVVRENKAFWFEILVAREENGVKHGLVKKEVAHPFGNDDVELLYWKLNVFKFSLHQSNG